MIFTETKLAGLFQIDIERREDERGFFARSFCRHEFEAHGLEPSVAQSNVSFNARRGTLRGMHYQVLPATEAKLVRCTRGAIYDVVVDLRDGSPTYLEHVGAELSEDNHRSLYIPPMFAHGFITLADDTEVSYQMSEFYTPECERGLHHADPALAIDWPIPVAVVSAKDASWPLLSAVGS